MGLQLGYLLGGSILIETVFSWPGTGLLLNSAIFQRDLPLLQGTILVLALFFVFLNLVVDVLQTALDPRIKRANHGCNEATHPPGPVEDRTAAPVKAQGYWTTVWRRLRRDPVAIARRRGAPADLRHGDLRPLGGSRPIRIRAR
jgi:hypothetical protein